MSAFQARARRQVKPLASPLVRLAPGLGVPQRLVASCLNDACRHVALIDVSAYPAETEVPSFRSRVKCGGSRGNKIDVRPNLKEQPMGPSLTSGLSDGVVIGGWAGRD